MITEGTMTSIQNHRQTRIPIGRTNLKQYTIPLLARNLDIVERNLSLILKGLKVVVGEKMINFIHKTGRCSVQNIRT
jgi:hypothetical protein